MSKIYDRYLELKKENQNYLYLFKSGKFYIFIADDADKINEYVVLKKTNLTKEICKCGFPDNSIEDYMRVFNNHNLNIKIIDSIDTVENNIIDKIKKLDIDKMSPIEALNFLNEVQKQYE